MLIITVMKAGEESPPNASQMGKKSGKKAKEKGRLKQGSMWLSVLWKRKSVHCGGNNMI